MSAAGCTDQTGLPPSVEQAVVRFCAALREAPPSGLARVPTAGWTGGMIVSFLVACDEVSEKAGRHLTAVLIGADVAERIGVRQRTGMPVVVGGLLCLAVDIESDVIEIGFAARGSHSLH